MAGKKARVAGIILLWMRQAPAEPASVLHKSPAIILWEDNPVKLQPFPMTHEPERWDVFPP
jgi:hypothetical protein